MRSMYDINYKYNIYSTDNNDIIEKYNRSSIRIRESVGFFSPVFKVSSIS